MFRRTEPPAAATACKVVEVLIEMGVEYCVDAGVGLLPSLVKKISGFVLVIDTDTADGYVPPGGEYVTGPVGGVTVVNVAVIEVLAFSVMPQVNPVPVQPPDHPVKVDEPSGAAVTVTAVPPL